MASYTTNLVILGGAGLSAALSPLIPNQQARAVVQVGAGLLILAAGIDVAITTKSLVVEEKKKIVDALKEAATKRFDLLGILARAADIEPGEGTVTDEATSVGTPRLPTSLTRVAGEIKRIEKQDISKVPIVQVPMFADTILVESVVTNKSSQAQKGLVSLRALRDETPELVEGPSLALAPGESRAVAMRVSRDYVSGHQLDVALRWNHYTLHRVVVGAF